MQIILALLAMLSACSQHPSGDINRPIAERRIPGDAKFADVSRAVALFADRNHFAVQGLISSRQGAMDFSMRLFRDDITVTVSRVHGDPIEINAFPLCSCESNRRLGLTESADAAVSELERDLAILK